MAVIRVSHDQMRAVTCTQGKKKKKKKKKQQTIQEHRENQGGPTRRCSDNIKSGFQEAVCSKWVGLV